MDDFEFVAVGKLGFIPTVPRNELAVEFHGNAVRFHAELLKEIGKRRKRAKFAVFAVYGEFHSATVARQTGGNVGLCKLIQPFSLFNGFGYFHTSCLCNRFECMLQLLSRGDEESSRDQRGAANSLLAMDRYAFALLNFWTE